MSVANAYAKALYQAATESKGAQSVTDLETQLAKFLEVVNSSKEAQTVLLGPIVTPSEKILVIQEISKKMGLSHIVTEFLALLARKGRLRLLSGVREAFRDVRLEAEGGVVGRLVAADPINESDVQGLAQAFSRKLGKRVEFNVSTDPALLAGMKVTVNGVTYDGTLRSQIQRLRDQFAHGIAQGQS